MSRARGVQEGFEKFKLQSKAAAEAAAEAAGAAQLAAVEAVRKEAKETQKRIEEAKVWQHTHGDTFGWLDFCPTGPLLDGTDWRSPFGRRRRSRRSWPISRAS